MINNLDATQKDIVNSTSKNIIISAGAGSGKTKVLVERIKHLLNNGVSPENIVAITFTNRAADEMKARLYDVKGIGDSFIGTIHSFANKIYKNSGKPYDLLTQEKEIDIMKFLISSYAKYLNIDIYLKYLEMMKDITLGVISEDCIQETFSIPVLDEINTFYKRNPPEHQFDYYPQTLYSFCRANNIITFNELLVECTEYFNSLGGKLEYLLVDELQDIGYQEYNFLKALNSDNNFFVGDDWQSIYGFKGGDVRIFKSIMSNKEWAVYYLQNNYRNARNILDLAGIVIKQVDEIIDKEIIPIRDDLGTVEIASKREIEKYLDNIKESGSYNDWFILTRNNKEVNELSGILTLKGIPFVTFKQSSSTLDAIDIKMALNSVKLLTIHTAKGLESKNVLLYGNFPVRQKNFMRNSDERKVLYVGITRAQDNLILLN